MPDARMSTASGARRAGPIRALACGALLLTGGVGLAFGTGARTADTAVAASLNKAQPALAGAWASPSAVASTQPQTNGAPVHLARLAGSKLKSGQMAGDESFWLDSQDGTAAAPNPIALGVHVTFAVPSGTAGTAIRSYEVIEMKPLIDTAATAVATDASPHHLMLVVCREVGAAAAPQTIRFLVDTDPGTTAPGSAGAAGTPKTL